MSATGLNTAEIVININKTKSHSGCQNNKPPCRILQLDIIQKQRASFASEVGREGHLIDAKVPLRVESRGESSRIGSCRD